MIAGIVLASVFAALSLSQRVGAFWILDPSSLVQERLDPIVSPRIVSNHVHNIAGASNFGPEVTYETLQASDCTSAPVQVDKSNYWAPQLYHQNSSGLTLIPIAFLNFYYLQRGGPSDQDAKNVKAFPKGLRMLAGNMMRTAYNESNVEDLAVNFKCLDYNGQTTTSNDFPATQCPDGLRAQIVFPSCWDGVNLDSTDHKSHVSYPVGGAPDSGDCPSTHPVKMVTLFNEWVFDVPKFPFESGAQNWVLAFGDETGLGFHADFVNGWDVEVLQAAIDQCTGDLFQNIEACPPFAGHIDREKAKSCTIQRVVEEEIDGPLQKLPGCQTIPFSGIQPCSDVPAIKGSSGGSSNGSPSGSSAASGTSSATSISTGSTTTNTGMTSPSSTLTSRSFTYRTTSTTSPAVSTGGPSSGTCKKKRRFDSRVPHPDSLKRQHNHKRVAHAHDISS